MNEILEQEKKNEKMPTFLLVLTILSLANIGWELLTNLRSMISGPASEEEMLQTKVEMTKLINQSKELDIQWVENLYRDFIKYFEVINANHSMTILVSVSILLIGLAGVLMMMKRKKIGFHIYIIYSLLATMQIYFFISPNTLSNFIVISGLLVSGAFVIMYSRNLAWLK